MNWPPSVMRIRIQRQQHRGIGLWLPLFIILPIVFVLTLALAPLVLLAAAILWRRGLGRLLLIGGPMILNCLCALRGLEVNVENEKECVFISFK